MGGRVHAVVCPDMSASSHVARIVLAAMHHDAGLQAALNIRYSEDVPEVVRDMGLAVKIEKLLGEGDV